MQNSKNTAKLTLKGLHYPPPQEENNDQFLFFSTVFFFPLYLLLVCFSLRLYLHSMDSFISCLPFFPYLTHPLYYLLMLSSFYNLFCICWVSVSCSPHYPWTHNQGRPWTEFCMHHHAWFYVVLENANNQTLVFTHARQAFYQLSYTTAPLLNTLNSINL